MRKFLSLFAILTITVLLTNTTAIKKQTVAVANSSSAANAAAVATNGGTAVSGANSASAANAQATNTGSGSTVAIANSKDTANSNAVANGGTAVSLANSSSAANAVATGGSTAIANSTGIATSTATATGTGTGSSTPVVGGSGSGVTTPPVTTITWFNTQYQAIDLGVGAEGDLYVVGLDGFLYYYEFLANNFCLVEGDFELTNIFRVDVSYDGTPYVVTACGDTYYLSCDRKWMRLPGCATDIGVGRAGEVFKVGCDARTGGFGVYRLFCKCPCKGCNRGCQRFRKPCSACYQHKGDKKKCYWFRIEGGAVRIDVAPTGFPVIINNTGAVFSYDGTNYTALSGVTAQDVTVSNEGMILVAAANSNIYEYSSAKTWVQIAGNATAITAGPYSQPWIINSSKYVLSSSKMGFN